MIKAPLSLLLLSAASLQGGPFLKNGGFEADPWLSGWAWASSLMMPVEENGITGRSVRIPANPPPVVSNGKYGVSQMFLDPGTGTHALQRDFTVSFDLRLTAFGSTNRNFTFALKNGPANVVVLKIEKGLLYTYNGSNWAALHNTATYEFKNPETIHHFSITGRGFGKPGANYDLTFTGEDGVSHTFTGITRMVNMEVDSVHFNSTYVQYDFIIDNVEFTPLQPSPYARWVSGFPGLKDVLYDGDPDGDHVKNLAEYVLGTNPATPNEDNGLYVDENRVFHIPRRQAPSGFLRQVFQHSGDLTHWTEIPLGEPGAAGVTIAPAAEEGMETTTITLPPQDHQEGKRFGRLRVEHTPAEEDGILAVHTDFQGGSARVISIDQSSRTVRIRPGGDFKRGWPCWWYFRLSGCNEGENLTIAVDAAGLTKADGAGLASSWVLPERAAVSHDGATWAQSAPRSLTGSVATWSIPATGKAMWIAWGPPFTPRDSENLVRGAARSPHAEAFELCKSNEGRSVPALRVTQDAAFADISRSNIWITARTHAWETGASWTCKGLVDWIVGDEPRARALRSRSIITIVPIVDIDNTYLGNGGKEAMPHDHNRDWTDQPVYAEVMALQEMIRGHHQSGRFSFFMDMHDPGAGAARAVYFISPDDILTPEGKSRMSRFIDISAEETTGPILINKSSTVVGPAYDDGWDRMSSNWVSSLVKGSDRFGICIEIPWNSPSSHVAGYTALGRQQGLAIERYLREAAE